MIESAQLMLSLYWPWVSMMRTALHVEFGPRIVSPLMMTPVVSEEPRSLNLGSPPVNSNVSEQVVPLIVQAPCKASIDAARAVPDVPSIKSEGKATTIAALRMQPP